MTSPLAQSSLLTPLISSAAMRAILDDRARVQRMLEFETALARAEAQVGIVPALAVERIAEAARADRYDLVAVGAGGGGDPLDGERRDDADLRLRARERNLEIEHALQARAIVEDRAHGRARDQRGQQ